jgi:hypothetical protein
MEYAGNMGKAVKVVLDAAVAGTASSLAVASLPTEQ